MGSDGREIATGNALITLDGTGSGYFFVEAGRINIDFNEPVYYKELNSSSGISNLYFSLPQKGSNSGFDTVSSEYETCYDLSSGTSTIRIKDPRFTDLATAKAILAETPLTVLLPLATPTTISVTPHTIPSQLGDNNVWSDVGDVAVTYRADIQKYIDNAVDGATVPDSEEDEVVPEEEEETAKEEDNEG